MGKRHEHRDTRRGGHEEDFRRFDDGFREPAYFQRQASPVRDTDTPVMAPDAAEEIEGIVKWYNVEKGFGFVSPANGGPDVFVHVTAVTRSGLPVLTEGQKVLVTCGQGRKGIEVHSVRAI
jgi:cold shock CspA family protein